MLTIRAYEFASARESFNVWDNLPIPEPDIWDAINFAWGVYAERILYDNRNMIIIVCEGNSDLPDIKVNGRLVSVPEKIVQIVKDRFCSLSRYVTEYSIEYLNPQVVRFDEQRDSTQG